MTILSSSAVTADPLGSGVPATRATATTDSVGTAERAPSQAVYLITSVVVASVLFLVGVGGGLLLANGDPPTAFAVGLFTAFWGGPGFGLMAGFALYNLRIERSSRH